MVDPLGISVDGVNSRLLDRRRLLKDIVNYTIENRADGFIFLGDIFDKINPIEKLRTFFIEDVISPLMQNEIPIILLAGNHDTNYDIVSFQTEAKLLSSLTKFSSIPISLIIEPCVIDFGDWSGYFVPYGFNIPTESDGCEILFGHHGIKEAETGAGVLERQGEQLEAKDFKAFNTVLLGHYHKPQQISYGGKDIWYVGSPGIWDMSERLDKKRFLDIEITNGSLHKIDSIPLNDRKFLRLDIKEGESWETTEDIKDAIVQLYFRGSKEWLKSLDFQRIKRNYEELEPHKVFFDTEAISKGSKNLINVQENVSEDKIIEEYMKKGNFDKALLPLGLKIFNET